MEFNGTFLISAVSFIVFVFVMNAILYAPLEKVVNQRKKFIDDNYDEVKSNEERSNALLKDRADKIIRAGVDAKSHLNAKTGEVKSKKDEMAKLAQQKTLEGLNLAKTELSNVSTEVKSVLKNDVVNLAQSISDKFLGEHHEIGAYDKNLVEKIMQEG